MKCAQLTTQLALQTLEVKLTEAGHRIVDAERRPGSLIWEGDENQSSALLKDLTAFLFMDWQSAYITRRVALVHAYLTDEETSYIALLTQHAITRDEDPVAGESRSVWHYRVQDALSRALDTGVFDLDAIMRFRCREYLAAVDDVVDEMVDQFLSDREYEEFVSMLRYLLETAHPADMVLHVYCTNDRVWITDAAGELVRDSEISVAAMEASEGEEVNAEDLAMSILVTRAPRHIVVHDLTEAPPWPSFAETVERVFLERSSRCTECSTCRNLREVDATRLYGEQLRKAAQFMGFDP